jgi:hypothetical protein
MTAPEGRKVFFFEKKKQKDFRLLGGGYGGRALKASMPGVLCCGAAILRTDAW